MRWPKTEGEKLQQHLELNNKTFVHLLTEAALYCNVIMKNAWAQQRSLCVHRFLYSYSVISKPSLFFCLVQEHWCQITVAGKTLQIQTTDFTLYSPLIINFVLGRKSRIEWSIRLRRQMKFEFWSWHGSLDFCADLSQHKHPTKSWGSTYLNTESDESRPRIVFFPSVIKPSAGPFCMCGFVKGTVNEHRVLSLNVTDASILPRI